MNTPSLEAEILKAARVAAAAHGQQRRKGTGEPYVVHPLRVAERVLTCAPPGELDSRAAVLAAVLHDVLEDTAVGRDALVADFGERVVGVVDELTQDMSLPKAERRELMIAHCGEMSLEARVVKLADRWDNLTDLAGFDAAFVARYRDEARRMLAAMAGTWPTAEEAIESLIST